jgi:hypothetical protein
LSLPIGVRIFFRRPVVRQFTDAQNFLKQRTRKLKEIAAPRAWVTPHYGRCMPAAPFRKADTLQRKDPAEEATPACGVSSNTSGSSPSGSVGP